MKNDNEIGIFKCNKIEIIDDKKFIQKLRNSKKLTEYIELNVKKNDEMKKIMKNEKMKEYTENTFDYLKFINAINENGQTENTNIIYGQIFTINYKKNILTIIDKKIYENHFEKTNEYNYHLNDVGVIEDETKIILNFINQIKQKNDCEFLLYVLSNRKSMAGRQKNNIKTEKEIDNLFKLWNITDKYYSYKQYKIYLNLYEELYIDALKKNSDINLSYYENIKEQIWKVKKEILKGD